MKALTGSGLLQQLVRFSLSSGLSAALSFVLPIVLHEIGEVPERLAVAIGFATAYLFNFMTLRVFVFRSQNSLRMDAIQYLPLNGAFRLCEYGAFLVLSSLLSVDYVLALFIILSVSTILKFFGYRRLFQVRTSL